MWGLHEPQMHVTGDVDGPVDAKWTMQKDFTMGEDVVKYKNQNFAFMQLKGNAEEHNILDGKTWYHIKYDNIAPRTALLFTFLPYNMDTAWTYEGGREHTANGGFTVTHKITQVQLSSKRSRWSLISRPTMDPSSRWSTFTRRP